MAESMEQLNSEGDRFFASDRKKEGLDSVEKNIAKILMDSPHYESLATKERLELIKSIKERFPGVSKYLGSE